MKIENSLTSWAYSFLAFPLSFLGIPLYLHLPKYFHEATGVSLTLIGIILFGSRLMDAILDPGIGYLSKKISSDNRRPLWVASLGLGIFFNGFFYEEWLMGQPILRFTLSTVGVYLCFSFIYINYYAQGVMQENISKASSYREMSAFLGMIAATLFPTVLMQYGVSQSLSFQYLGACFFCLILIGLRLLPRIKQNSSLAHISFRETLKKIGSIPALKSLIILFGINTLPVAITSSLFEFYVDIQLNSSAQSGLYLGIYLLFAAIGAILGGAILTKVPGIQALRGFMLLSILSFSGTFFISHENASLFYGVCVFSGLGLGGELTVFPVLASEILKKHTDLSTSYFGVWASVNKFTLSIGAGIFLPLLDLSKNILQDYSYGTKIAFLYGVIPFGIKLMALTYVTLKSSIFKEP